MRIDRIREALVANYPDHQALEITDLSHQHSGRAGTESHFQVLLVSERFSGLNRVKRQRSIYQLFQSEFDQGLHALSLRLLTPEEHSPAQSENFQAPNCQSSKS